MSETVGRPSPIKDISFPDEREWISFPFSCIRRNNVKMASNKWKDFIRRARILNDDISTTLDKRNSLDDGSVTEFKRSKVHVNLNFQRTSIFC